MRNIITLSVLATRLLYACRHTFTRCLQVDANQPGRISLLCTDIPPPVAVCALSTPPVLYRLCYG